MYQQSAIKNNQYELKSYLKKSEGAFAQRSKSISGHYSNLHDFQSDRSGLFKSQLNNYNSRAMNTEIESPHNFNLNNNNKAKALSFKMKKIKPH